MEGHSELLNEGVEVLGGLPAVLEETECLLRVIKMQMRRMEEKKRVFRENVAGDHGDPLPGKLCLLCGSLATGIWRESSKGQAQPMGSGYPKYLGSLGCRISLLFNPSSTHWGAVLPKATIWGVPGSQSQSKTCF